MFVGLEAVPIEAFKGTWTIEQKDNKLGVELTVEDFLELTNKYVWVKTNYIDINARHLLNNQNTFEHSGESWEIIDIEVWDIIQKVQQKTEFILRFLPNEIRSSQIWNRVIIGGEERAIIEQSLYQEIIRTYIWVPLDSIPPQHRYKGEILGGESLIVLKRNILGTIKRAFHSRG